MVDKLLSNLEHTSKLPTAALLDQSLDLEASALRALDLSDCNRLAALLHADDPILLSSSAGAAQSVLNIVAEWECKHGACFH
eukprot:6860647-Karenia_brevis.AAC.1